MESIDRINEAWINYLEEYVTSYATSTNGWDLALIQRIARIEFSGKVRSACGSKVSIKWTTNTECIINNVLVLHGHPDAVEEVPEDNQAL